MPTRHTGSQSFQNMVECFFLFLNTFWVEKKKNKVKDWLEPQTMLSVPNADTGCGIFMFVSDLYGHSDLNHHGSGTFVGVWGCFWLSGQQIAEVGDQLLRVSPVNVLKLRSLKALTHNGVSHGDTSLSDNLSEEDEAEEITKAGINNWKNTTEKWNKETPQSG